MHTPNVIYTKKDNSFITVTKKYNQPYSSYSCWQCNQTLTEYNNSNVYYYSLNSSRDLKLPKKYLFKGESHLHFNCFELFKGKNLSKWTEQEFIEETPIYEQTSQYSDDDNDFGGYGL
jgi:hypothetical protein